MSFGQPHEVNPFEPATCHLAAHPLTQQRCCCAAPQAITPSTLIITQSFSRALCICMEHVGSSRCNIAPDMPCIDENHVPFIENCLQVVVFALGIGTKMQHAEQLIAAFQILCQQCQRGQGSAATDPQQPDLGKLQLVPSAMQQQLSLRNAFFASSIRLVSLSSVKDLECSTMQCRATWCLAIIAIFPSALVQATKVQAARASNSCETRVCLSA